ncbi:hypothetical protein Tco_1520512, partial [Tanacetum coccineum]
ESDAELEGVDEAERKFDQLAKDEEIAKKVQENWEAEEEMKKLAKEEATKAAPRIEADRLLAVRLQEEERETFTVEERAKFLYDTIAAQRRFLAQQRVKHVDLKNKNFEEIQVLYKEVKRFDKNFIAIGSAMDERQIKEINEESKDPKKKRLKKRVLHKVSSPDGDYLVVYKVNGYFRAFNYLMEVLHILNRQDLFHLYELVMKQYSEITPEGIELILWGDLKIMIESSTKENDQELMDRTVIHMLVERRCSLSKELLQRMLDLGLEVEEESTAVLHVVRFIKQQLNKE